MEILDEKIENFLKIETNLDLGFGYGEDPYAGCNSGFGSGAGYGDGSGYGDGEGIGSGFGFGMGNGDGYGYGNIVGPGSGEGDGVGYGHSDFDICEKINGYKVYEIDNVNTIITVAHNNIAKGFIVKHDLTLVPTYVVKGSNLFAHGKTLKEAFNALEQKIYANLDTKEAIKLFKEKFNNKDSYSGHDFFNWHHIITGSCLQGRNEFISNGGYNLDDKYTVKQFLKIVKNAYGWSMLKELETYYK